jgi:hypothetical protein
VLVPAIERQGLVVAGLGKSRASRLVVNVAEMPNRMSQGEGLFDLAEDEDGFLVVPSSCIRSIRIRQVPLELAQIPERPRQLDPTVFLPQKTNGEEKVAVGVGETVFSSRLVSLLEEVGGGIGHCGTDSGESSLGENSIPEPSASKTASRI